MADSPKRCAARSLHGCAAAADAHYLLHPLFRVSRPNRWLACIFVPICHDRAIEPCAIMEQSQLFSGWLPSAQEKRGREDARCETSTSSNLAN